MNIDHIRIFLDVAQRLNFAAVAEDRGLNASSVSRAIAQLEDTIGARLIQRSTRAMTLTEAGDVFRRNAQSIVDELDHTIDQTRAIDTGPMGTLKMSASVAFGEEVIVPLLPKFRETFPDIGLDLVFTDVNVDLVAEGFDLAIRLGPMITTDVIQTKLMSTHYRICATPEYLNNHDPASSPSDLSSHSCVAFALPSFREAWRFRSKDKPEAELMVPIKSDIAIASALSVKSAALASLGPALLADWLIQNELEDGRLIDLFPDYDVTATEFDTAAWLIYPSRSFLPQKVRVMIDYLKSEISSSHD